MTETSYQFLTGVGICAGIAAAGLSLGLFLGRISVKPIRLFTVTREELWKAVRRVQ